MRQLLAFVLTLLLTVSASEAPDYMLPDGKRALVSIDTSAKIDRPGSFSSQVVDACFAGG